MHPDRKQDCSLRQVSARSEGPGQQGLRHIPSWPPPRPAEDPNQWKDTGLSPEQVVSRLSLLPGVPLHPLLTCVDPLSLPDHFQTFPQPRIFLSDHPNARLYNVLLQYLPG